MLFHIAKDGTVILIQNGWFEQPPQAADRDKLANHIPTHNEIPKGNNDKIMVSV